jgi:ribosome-associated translation inhibitor RaiA
VGGGVAAGGGGIAGAIIAIVGAVIQIGAAIAQVVQSLNQAAIDEAINDINTKIEKLKLNLENISNITGIGDGWFTEDAFQGVRNINDQINLLVKNLRDLTNSYNSTITASLISRDEWYKIFFGDLDREPEDLDWFERYLGEIGSMLKEIPSNIASVDIGSIFRDLDLDTLSKLKKELEQLDLEGTNEALRDSVVERIELLEQAFTDMREAVRNILGDISGKMLDTVIEKWDEIRESGIDAFGGIEGAASHMAESVKKDVAGMIKDMVAQQLWAATMSKYFDTLGEDLTQAILGGASPTDMLPIFNTFWGV